MSGAGGSTGSRRPDADTPPWLRPAPSGPTFADFADGEHARLARVGLRLYPHERPDRLVLALPDGAEQVWPLEELRLVPGQADPEAFVLTSMSDPLARLYLGKGPLAARISAHAPALHAGAAPPPPRRRLLKWGGAALASVALIIFVLVPVMADQLARFLPPEGERALGDATFEQIRKVLDQSGIGPVRICETGKGREALDAMLARLAPEVDDLPYPVRLSVLDHDLINAFTLPGGRIILFRGLIEAADSPDEVAAVLAHEIGHAVYRDPTRDALRTAGSIGVLGLLLGDFAGGTVVLFLANSLINAQYSQAAETRADEYAHILLKEAGVSPAALGRMFVRLRDEYGDASGFVAHFASHPTLAERIAASEAAAEGVTGTEPVLGARQWQALSGICSPLPPNLAPVPGKLLGSDMK